MVTSSQGNSPPTPPFSSAIVLLCLGYFFFIFTLVIKLTGLSVLRRRISYKRFLTLHLLQALPLSPETYADCKVGEHKAPEFSRNSCKASLGIPLPLCFLIFSLVFCICLFLLLLLICFWKQNKVAWGLHLKPGPICLSDGTESNPKLELFWT